MTNVFTDEFKSNFDSSDSPYNGSFIKNLTINEKLIELRNRIEDMIGKYPKEKKSTIIENIRSFNEIISRSNLSELYTYNILYNNYQSVEVEKPLDFVNNKTPDFWVDQNKAFEVFSTFETDNPIEYAIHETINAISTERKIILGPIKNLSDEIYPKLSEIRHYFLGLLNREPNSKDPEPFIKRFSQGFILSGKLYKGNKRHTTIGAKIGGVITNTGYISSVRKRIKDKISKYSGISKSGYPLIIVIYNYNDFLDNNDIYTVLFGDEIHEVDMNTGKVTISHKNGLIRKDINTSLSSILVRKRGSLDEYHLVNNPFARVQLGKHEEKIIKSFKVA